LPLNQYRDLGHRLWLSSIWPVLALFERHTVLSDVPGVTMASIGSDHFLQNSPVRLHSSIWQCQWSIEHGGWWRRSGTPPRVWSLRIVSCAWNIWLVPWVGGKLSDFRRN
jgi:hypothetical protein